MTPFRCTCCGCTDARTNAGGLFCHECGDLTSSERRMLALERLSPAQGHDSYEDRAAA